MLTVRVKQKFHKRVGTNSCIIMGPCPTSYSSRSPLVRPLWIPFSYRIQGSHISEKYGLPNPVPQCQRDNIQVLALILSLVFRGQSFYTRGHHSMHWVVDQRTCVRIDGGERGRYCRSPLWEHPRTVPTRISQVPTASRPYRLPLFQCLALTIKILRGLMP